MYFLHLLSFGTAVGAGLSVSPYSESLDDGDVSAFSSTFFTGI